MEVINFGERNNTRPLLFVHGSYCGAWIWEKYFLPYFAKEGFHGAAISLRGHGSREEAAKIDSYGIADFVEDIHEASELFDEAPILIGHSLGGYLVQRYALDHDVVGMVLLSSPALSGLSASSQHILLHNPLLAMQLGLLMTMGPAFVNEDIIGCALFMSEIPEDDRRLLTDHFQSESNRVANEALFPCLRQPQHKPPTLVLGGDYDAFIPYSDFVFTAKTWDGDLQIMKNVPHGVMIDPSWPRVAEAVRDWLKVNAV